MLKPASYAFRNDDTSITTLDSIGWQKIDCPAYSFAGDNRPDAGHVSERNRYEKPSVKRIKK